MWPATNVLKMGRERTTRHPRQLAGVSGYNLEVKVVDELTRPPTETRVYDDGEGKIEAVIVASLPVDEINPIVAEYLYDGKPVPELWPTEGQDQYGPRIAEMVTACKAFGRLGCKGVAMVSRDPPYPDLFVQSPLTGEIAVEITLGRDEEEAAFQSRRAALQKLLNDIATDQGLVLPYDVNISVVELPRAKGDASSGRGTPERDLCKRQYRRDLSAQRRCRGIRYPISSNLTRAGQFVRHWSAPR